MKFLGAIVAVGLATIVTLSCGGEKQVASPDTAIAWQLMADTEAHFGDLAIGVDPWEVVICQIPRDTTDPMYEPVDERLNLNSQDIVSKLAPVVDYFSRWSHGRYQPNFTAASGVSISAEEKSDTCVDRALDKSAPTTRGVLVITNAQHTELAVGGWGRPGAPCIEDCSAKTTRRAVYLGASDFMPFWKNDPPLDLVEHEMGHALDWPHSSSSVNNFGNGVYDSDIDVMSNSAAPRNFFASARNAPGPLAINMFLAKWFQEDQIKVLDVGTYTVELVATDTDIAVDGIRLLAVPVDESSIITVELIKASGDNQHLRHDRVVVHQIEVVGDSGYERQQTVLNDDLEIGETWSHEQLLITVNRMSTDQLPTTAIIEVTRQS